MEGDKDRASQQVNQLEGDEESSVSNTECVNKSLPSGTTATHNHPKKTRAEYQREYRQRIKAKQNALEADKKENLKKNRADYAKNLRARQKEMRQQCISTETEITQHDKLDQERKRKAANSKAYRERKKRLIDQSDTRKTEESATAKIFAEPKQKSAANLKAWRGKKKLEKYAAEENRILENQR